MKEWPTNSEGYHLVDLPVGLIWLSAREGFTLGEKHRAYTKLGIALKQPTASQANQLSSAAEDPTYEPEVATNSVTQLPACSHNEHTVKLTWERYSSRATG